jgi:hypothetical protein
MSDFVEQQGETINAIEVEAKNAQDHTADA